MLEIGDKFILLHDLLRRVEKLYPISRFVELEVTENSKSVIIQTLYKGEYKHNIKVIKSNSLFEVVALATK